MWLQIFEITAFQSYKHLNLNFKICNHELRQKKRINLTRFNTILNSGRND